MHLDFGKIESTPQNFSPSNNQKRNVEQRDYLSNPYNYNPFSLNLNFLFSPRSKQKENSPRKTQNIYPTIQKENSPKEYRNDFDNSPTSDKENDLPLNKQIHFFPTQSHQNFVKKEEKEEKEEKKEKEEKEEKKEKEEKGEKEEMLQTKIEKENNYLPPLPPLPSLYPKWYHKREMWLKEDIALLRDRKPIFFFF